MTTMNLISKILLPNHILLDEQSRSKKEIFERAGLLFENNQAINRSLIFDSLMKREQLGSTGLGKGVAMPHGRIAKLREATAAFIKTTHPIPFDSPDKHPVNLVFVLLVPERATDLHLQILGELAQMFSDTDFRQQLIRCQQPAELYQLFYHWQAN
jgi:PTS system nitrogen regulatory IIA component